MGVKILIIKLAAMGDVLRTTPILTALRARFEPCHITWVVRPESTGLLEGLPEIDRLLPLNMDTVIRLGVEEFDHAYCFDKEPAAIGLAARVRSPRKYGFLMDEKGSLVPADKNAEYAYQLGFDDDLKYFRNKKTYQQILFEMGGMEFRGEGYRFEIDGAAREWATSTYDTLGVSPGERLVGINVGSGDQFAYKGWRVDGFAELAGRIHGELGMRIVLLGGERERERVRAIIEQADCRGLIDPGATPSLHRFAALVSRCRLVVTGDTLAMHMALATGLPVVVIFGSTCAQEIEVYGRGRKIVPTVDCHPCYKKTCDLEKTCVDSISTETVFQGIKDLLEELD